ncbi:DUF1839 family protein [Verrucosispora sp. TAA-831]|uniref:DUF1839 family protein n=1 Tax=Verrucosispora sp. TAA-831 TaxID=3422227 RepID=UPI003D6E9184
MRRVLAVSRQDHVAHPLHGCDQIWSETSCSLDVWVEVIHALGLDPAAGLASTLSADFLDDQWQFLKFPPEDLRDVFGLVVDEVTLWRPLIDHIEHFLGAGRLLTVEVDSWFLPDTAGRSYHTEHVKSTIVPNAVDRAGRRLEYFHNTGYHDLSGDDFEGLFLAGDGGGHGLPPYVEVVRLDGVVRSDVLPRALRAARSHLARRPADNPVDRLGHRLEEELVQLSRWNEDMFHRYAFATVRQCGATAQLAGSFARWLHGRADLPLHRAAECFETVAAEAKSLQFKLSRITRGRAVETRPAVAVMAANWANGLAVMAAGVGDGSPIGHPAERVSR